ncbi:uncharacterized protein LOC105422747 [Pogonomyrmex barbatus]|uniref:Uncharacterized protein LOC105422747 n=1 Tax=Pogonomyrmex barbatus TaxID=144034 RepID=A0A6I9VXB2_9HYME|nr:uncharacterized protein LOC105422747 [Pogonomyrmex barbatus]
MTQLFTGHGCFSVYLKRIGRYYSDGCEHCERGRDDASHILSDCDAWSFWRDDLALIVENTLRDDTLVPILFSGEENWGVVSSFSEEIMCIKEDAERRRQLAVEDPTK